MSQKVTTNVGVDINYLDSKLREAVNHFDTVLGNIVTINTDIHDPRTLSSVLIDSSLLTGEQCEAIVQLSGYLQSIEQHVKAAKLQQLHQNSMLKDIDVNLSDRAQREEKSILKLQKKISLLQDMLVSEMNRSEGLEVSLRRVEEQIVSYADENKKLKAKLERTIKKDVEHAEGVRNGVRSASFPLHSNGQSHSNETLNGQTASTKLEKEAKAVALKTEYASYAGRYVRKEFDGKKYFGLVLYYDEPWFMVLYQDGDREEIDFKELSSIFWNSPVPSLFVSQLQRFRVKFQNEQSSQPQSSQSSSSELSKKELLGLSNGVTTSANISQPKANNAPQSQLNKADRQISESSLDSGRHSAAVQHNGSGPLNASLPLVRSLSLLESLFV